MKKLLPAIVLVCLGKIILNAQPTHTFTGKPIFDIEARQNNTSLGVIKIELFPNIAPLHAMSFDSLVSVQFYDTTAFHRVIPNFMIQGGDPNSRSGPASTWGQGNPSQPTVPAEFSVAQHLRGIVSGARKSNDINSYTSQFFICVANSPSLDNNYTVFGRVLSGMDVADVIVNTPRNLTNDRPLQKIEMFVKRNGSNDSVPSSPQLLTPPDAETDLDSWSVVQLKWDRVSDAQIYELQVATDATFSNNLVDRKLTGLNHNLLNLMDATTYFWRVRCNNGGHFSPWVQRSFTTLDRTVGLKNYEPVEIRVFPNPSEGKFLFTGLPPGCQVSVYDQKGSVIVKERSSEHGYTLDLKAQKAGIYLYSITNGSREIAQGRLMLR